MSKTRASLGRVVSGSEVAAAPDKVIYWRRASDLC